MWNPSLLSLDVKDLIYNFSAAARPAAPAQRTVPASKPAPSRGGGGAGDAKTVAPSGGGNTTELNARLSELKLEVWSVHTKAYLYGTYKSMGILVT